MDQMQSLEYIKLVPEDAKDLVDASINGLRVALLSKDDILFFLVLNGLFPDLRLVIIMAWLFPSSLPPLPVKN
jgi:hypothetical protein